MECCLGHLLDLRCCDLVWLQLNPEGGFPVNLWSLSRRCLSDLYLSMRPMGKWRWLSWQWFGVHAISGWLLPPPLPNNAVTLLTTSTLSTSPMPDTFFFLLLSLSQYILFKPSEYRGWIYIFLCREMGESLLSPPGKFNSSTAFDDSWLKKSCCFFSHLELSLITSCPAALFTAVIIRILTNSLYLRLSSLTGICPLMVYYVLWSVSLFHLHDISHTVIVTEYSRHLSPPVESRNCSSFTVCPHLRWRKCLDTKLCWEILNAMNCFTVTNAALTADLKAGWENHTENKIYNSLQITKSIP